MSHHNDVSQIDINFITIQQLYVQFNMIDIYGFQGSKSAYRYFK